MATAAPARPVRFRWTIRRKLLALGAGTLIPLALLFAHWVRWEVRESFRDAESPLALASEQAAAQVGLLLEQVRRHLEMLARHPAIRARQRDAIEALARHFTLEHPELENLFAADSGGRVVASGAPLGTEISVADRRWFAEIRRTGRPAIGGYQIGRITGLPVVIVAAPLASEDGGFAGVIAAGVSLRRLHDYFRALPLSGGMAVTVLDGEGLVLSHHPPQYGNRIGQQLPSFSDFPAGPAGRGVVQNLAWPDGVERIAGVTPVESAGWRIVVSMPRAALVARVWREIGTAVLPMVAILAFASVIGLLIAQRVWRPLEALARSVARFPRERTIAVPARSTDEVGDLARSFAAMAEDINAMRADLERRVLALGALNEAGELLTSTLDVAEVAQRLAELVRTRIAAGVVRIWLREGTSDEYRLHAGAGVTRAPDEYRIHLGPGEGLVGWIVAHREPIVLADTLADPRLSNREWILAEGIQAFLGVPIVLEDAPVGVLACMNRERREFSAEDVRLAQLLALPAAIAIRNARLHHEVRTRADEIAQRNGQLALLHDAARTVLAERDLGQILQRLVETARQLVGARYAALAVFDRNGRVRDFFTDGASAEARARIGAPPEGRGLLAHVWRHAQSLRLDDLTTHPAAVGFPPGHPRMRTFLAVPVGRKDALLGSLHLTEKPGGFSEDDEALLSTLSADAAVATENAELLASLRRAFDDLERAQAQLVETEALRAVGQLAAGAAHHLNNILAVVRGRALLLLRHVEDAATRRALEIVDRAAIEGAGVIRGLQEFSRAQSAGRVARVDLNRIVEDALALTRARWRDDAERRGAAIETSLDAAAPSPVAGDEDALREVLVSLIFNAVDAMPGGGRIAIRTWIAGDRVHCAVTDTGTGMPEDVRRQALEPFFTTKGPKSRGLGLSVSHGILRRHGGELVITSAPNEGTTVTISLPVAAAEEPAEPAPGVATLTGPFRILVIDDDEEVRVVLAEHLGMHGHVVERAASGPEGLALFRTKRHDIVFTDLGMPEMNGEQVAAAVKAESPATPVVLVTGWGEAPPSVEPSRCPWDEVVAKPFDADALPAAIARAFARSRR